MRVINFGELFSSLFTYIKLGVSVAILVVLVNQITEAWEQASTETTTQAPDLENILRINQK